MKATYYSTTELAEKTGTSRQVISAILNEKWREKRISEATYRRVREAMDRLGYVPDRTAVSLKKHARSTIGIVCHGPLYSHMLVATEKLNHYLLGNRVPVEMRISAEEGLAGAVRDLMGGRVEQVVILLSPMTRNFCERDLADPALHSLLSAVPAIIYNFPFDVHGSALEEALVGKGCHLVGFSRAEVYAECFEALHASGKTRILVDEKIDALVCGEPVASGLYGNFEHVETYPNPQSGQLEENPYQIGEELARSLLPLIQENQIDCLLTSSDRIAQGAAAALAAAGIGIPGELGLFGFDRIDALPYFKHPISTIEVPVAGMIADLIRVIESPAQKSGQAHRSQASVYSVA